MRHTLKFALEDCGAELKVAFLPTVIADSRQLFQVFQNLVSNALKFSRPVPPRIRVGCQHVNGQPRFFVRDNGIGIAADYIQRIFLLFQRLHTRKEYSGTGIGLALCKKNRRTPRRADLGRIHLGPRLHLLFYPW